MSAIGIAVIGVGACAHEAQVERRLLVKAHAPGEPSQIALWVGQSAGVPARYLAAAGAQWHALALMCRPSVCETAMQGLAADRAHFEAVQSDERIRTPQTAPDIKP